MGVGIGSGRSLENVHSESDTIGTVDLPQAMPFPLPVNHKFTCVALENVSVDRTLRDPIDLGDGIWILFEPPFPLDHAWREWLGSIRAQNYERTNLALIAHAHSARPVVLDHQNEALRQPVLSLCYALFLIDVFHHDGGLIISGANVDGTVNIRQVAHLETLYRPNGVRIARLDRASLLTAVCVAAGGWPQPPRTAPERFPRMAAWCDGIQWGRASVRLFLGRSSSVPVQIARRGARNGSLRPSREA